MLFSAGEIDEREREREREGERERDEKERKCACNKRLQLAKAVLSLEIEAGNVEPIYEWEIICNYYQYTRPNIIYRRF